MDLYLVAEDGLAISHPSSPFRVDDWFFALIYVLITEVLMGEGTDQFSKALCTLYECGTCYI